MIWFKPKHFLYVAFCVLFIWISMQLTEFEFQKFSNVQNMVTFLAQWFPMDWVHLPILLEKSLITLAMAFLGSSLGLFFAIPLSFAAARNTSRFLLFYGSVRIFLSLLRSIPEIVFGLIFVTVLGLGPFPAVIAIFVHNVGVLGKLISELIEAADEGPQEAMRAVGAKRTIGHFFSILPQIWPNVLSHYFYRFEVAIRTSIVLGIVGGGGIGQRLIIHFKTFQYPAVAIDVLLIMLMVIAVDFFGSKVREKVI